MRDTTTQQHDHTSTRRWLRWELENYREMRGEGSGRREALRFIIDLRGRLGWRLHEVGMAVLVVARRLCDDVPSDFTEEWEDGRAFGERRVWRAVIRNADETPITELHHAARDAGTRLSEVYREAGL